MFEGHLLALTAFSSKGPSSILSERFPFPSQDWDDRKSLFCMKSLVACKALNPREYSRQELAGLSRNCSQHFASLEIDLECKFAELADKSITGPWQI